MYYILGDNYYWSSVCDIRAELNTIFSVDHIKLPIADYMHIMNQWNYNCNMFAAYGARLRVHTDMADSDEFRFDTFPLIKYR